MRILPFALAAASVALATSPAVATVINLSPADGATAYTKIEAAVAGDEVIIAPGTYAFRVYLENKGTPAHPIYIHAKDPANPPVWDPGTTLVNNLPGSYTAGDKARGCWQISGGTGYIIEGITVQNCHATDHDSAGLRYYNGANANVLRSVLFQQNDNGLTGGTSADDGTKSELTVEFSEFNQNGNLSASSSSPTHNIYIYGNTFTLRYSYLHDPIQGQNLHCRAVNATIEYNWFDRAKSYVGDLMTSDDYANQLTKGTFSQSMTLLGNVIFQSPGQANNSQIFAIYNDEASGSPVSFSVTALYNTVIGAGGHAAFLHVSNADGTTMTAHVANNIIAGTSQPVLIEDNTHATVTGSHNWVETGADTTSLAGSIVGASPGFTDAAKDDFTLATGSACIGAADKSVSGKPTYEYYENETVTRMYRVRAAALDLGAFEHTTTGPGLGADNPPDAGAGGGGSGSSSSGMPGSTQTETATGTGTLTGAGTGTATGTGAGAGGGANPGGGGGAGSGTANSSGGCHCTLGVGKSAESAGQRGEGRRVLVWLFVAAAFVLARGRHVGRGGPRAR